MKRGFIIGIVLIILVIVFLIIRVDFTGEVIKSSETQQSITKTYIYAGNLLASKSSENPDDTNYYIQDYLGSNRKVIDGEVQENDFYAFGEEKTTTGNSNNNYKYTGKELDDETGLYYYGARYYKPELGRFIQADSVKGSLKEPLSLNRYAYVKNNPLKYVDPSGNAGGDFNFVNEAYQGNQPDAIVTRDETQEKIIKQKQKEEKKQRIEEAIREYMDTPSSSVLENILKLAGEFIKRGGETDEIPLLVTLGDFIKEQGEPMSFNEALRQPFFIPGIKQKALKGLTINRRIGVLRQLSNKQDRKGLIKAGQEFFNWENIKGGDVKLTDPISGEFIAKISRSTNKGASPHGLKNEAQKMIRFLRKKLSEEKNN